MKKRRGNEEHRPEESGPFIHNDAGGIMLAEDHLRLLGGVNGQKGEGGRRQQEQSPGQRRQRQIEGDGGEGSRGPRSEGKISAATPGGDELDQGFIQTSPHPSGGPSYPLFARPSTGNPSGNSPGRRGRASPAGRHSRRGACRGNPSLYSGGDDAKAAPTDRTAG